MTSVDELFQKSGVPSKRKFAPIRDPNEVYKTAKLSANGSSSSARHAQVPDTNGGADDDDGDDGDYGPAPPPEDDAEEDEPGDDEEGRFFGGGITRTEASILDYVDGQDGGAGPAAGGDTARRKRGGGGGGADEDDGLEGAVAAAPATTFDAAWLRRTALNLEKRINRNAELRARYEAEPTRFIASEADLDADIRALSILGEHPALYPEFARLGTAASLVSLLAHDNTDIAISAIEILGELTDEDVDATDAQWAALVDALLDADLVGLLVSNLARLDEDAADDADRTGVYYALGIVENLCSFRGSATEGATDAAAPQKEEGEADDDEHAGGITKAAKAAEVLGRHDGLVRWLLQRVQRKEAATPGGSAVSQNRQYAAEILAILAQASPANCRHMVALGAIDVLLQLVAPYRRRDPERGGSEEEYMENLFEALACLVSDADATDTTAASAGGPAPARPEDVLAARTQFIEAEGVELCLLLLHDGHKSRAPALRLLDYAASGVAGGNAVCRQLVEAGGLKTIFTLFMRGDDAKKHKKKKHHSQRKNGHEEGDGLRVGPTADHLVALFASLLRLLPAESPERIRLLAKFVERDYEKVARLMALRAAYAARVALVDRQMDDEGRGLAHAAALAKKGQTDEADALAAERLARRLDAGLFTLQGIDIILAWLVAEDDGAGRAIRTALADRDDTVAVLRQSLQERRDELDQGVAEGKDMHEVLTALLECLQ